MSDAGLDYVRTGAWVKVGATPQFSGDRPAVGFEAVTICHPPGRKHWNGGGKHAVWTHPIVLDRGKTGARMHTTQKPLGLMESLVSLFTDRDETVLDAFMGSGTTGVACIKLGRRFIGIERDPKYFEAACGRIEDAQRQGRLIE
jgi:DNA modification methylase